jgi:hypothetical protein
MANPYYQQPQNFQTQTYQTPQSSYSYMPQTQQQNGSLMTVIVNGEDDVNVYPVAPGVTVMLISFEKNKFWLKSRGNDGVPLPIRSFPFKEEQPIASNQNEAVSRKEFDELTNKLNKLLDELGGAK